MATRRRRLMGIGTVVGLVFGLAVGYGVGTAIDELFIWCGFGVSIGVGMGMAWAIVCTGGEPTR